MSKTKANYLASLDIGSTKVVLAVAQQVGSSWEVVAIAQAPHKGFHQGQIIDAKEVSSAIRKTRAEVELVSGISLSAVFVSFADITVERLYSKGTVAIRKIITDRDIEALRQSALESAQIRSDREVLFSQAQQFRIDNQRYDEAPVGQKASALETTLTILTAARKNVQMVRECVESCGFVIREIIPQCLATVHAVTTVEQQKEGVGVVDLGGMLTDIIAYKNGKIVMATSLPVGGIHFTQDLAIALKTPQTFAEKLKKNYGAALVDIVSSEIVPIESIKNEPQRTVDTRFVSEVLEARAEETMGFIFRKMNEEDLLFNLKKGIIITGGASQLPGLSELGEFTFDVPLQRGAYCGSVIVTSVAHQSGILTALGILNYAQARHSLETVEFSIQTFKSRWEKLKNMIDNIL